MFNTTLFLSNRHIDKSLFTKWWSFFTKKMSCSMLSVRHKFKIFYAVIRFDAVYMMDKLIRFEFSTKMFFHYNSVFKQPIIFTIAKNLVSIFSKRTSTIFSFNRMISAMSLKSKVMGIAKSLSHNFSVVTIFYNTFHILSMNDYLSFVKYPQEEGELWLKKS